MPQRAEIGVLHGICVVARKPCAFAGQRKRGKDTG
jgi:hypothetical protein